MAMVGAALQSTAVAVVSDRVGSHGRSGVAGSSGGFGRGSDTERLPSVVAAAKGIEEEALLDVAGEI
jgi:hypothetical protein